MTCPHRDVRAMKATIMQKCALRNARWLGWYRDIRAQDASAETIHVIQRLSNTFVENGRRLRVFCAARATMSISLVSGGVPVPVVELQSSWVTFRQTPRECTTQTLGRQGRQP